MAREYWKKLRHGQLEQVQRECLKCNGKFTANGRLNRVCPRCQRTNNSLSTSVTSHSVKLTSKQWGHMPSLHLTEQDVIDGYVDGYVMGEGQRPLGVETTRKEMEQDRV